MNQPTNSDTLEQILNRFRHGLMNDFQNSRTGALLLDQALTALTEREERIKREANLQGRIEAGVELRKSVVSTSPFLEHILNPYITRQRQILKAELTKDTKG